MQFKELEWRDIISDGVIVCSVCEVKICGWISLKQISERQPRNKGHSK